jgi:2-desacetyl-2-hydroxyethyl bacteriochlorophyllide A dehydrogenase
MGHGNFKTLDLPMPSISHRDDVLINMKCSSCNIEEIKALGPADDMLPSGKTPFVWGTEMSGVIERMGPGAKEQGFREGDRITGFYRTACGKCHACLEGNELMCINMHHPPYGMAEYTVWRSRQLYRLPESLGFDEGCLTVSVAAMLRAIDEGHVRPGRSVAVIGADFSGILLIRLLKLAGAVNITVFERSERKRRRAAEAGAALALDPENDRLSKAIVPLAPARGFHTIIDTASDPELLSLLMNLAADSGFLVIPTLYAGDTILPVNLSRLYFNELTIRVIKQDPRYMSRALAVMPRLKLRELISRRLSLDEAPQMYELAFYEDNIKGIVAV